MERTNRTAPNEFILLGFSKYPKLEIFFFVLCMIIYIVILFGNSVIIILSILDSHLHTPMYFFLSNLSFLDICYTSSFVPKMLVNFLSTRKSLSFSGCAAQMSISFAMGTTECILLAVMAYDRYVAICNPLRYPIVINRTVYVNLAALCWLIGGLDSLFQTILIMQLPFCGENVIDHFTCEILAVMHLACIDISLNELIMLVGAIIVTLIPLLLIIVSYVFILSTILKIRSAEGRNKAFSTCSAHLTVVIIFYGTILFIYMKPKSKASLTTDKLITLFYGIFTPMLNPIIYSLRNKDVNAAVKKVLSRNLSLWKL
ncbi:olfactory receptor 13D1-like [Sarcophilus harrisii]|uniref:olfactory receptor 13D1-like n=1 Tax=Sarcophilus harrisii TaxID=9305 RepID=UPI00062B2E44|nr:olfactory receptor 13D1-like [Sarcophilus harrisii]